MGRETGRGADGVAVVPGPDAGTGLASVAGPGRSAVEGSSLAEDLRALEALVDRLTATDIHGLDGPAAEELVTVLTGATDRLTALRVRALPCVETDGRWALDGTRTFAQWVAQRVGGSVSQARRDVRLGRALREELPATADAVTTGQVGVEHARVLATVAATSPVRREVLAGDTACNEDFLLAQARVLGVDQFRTLVRNWAAAADPDADDRGYKEAVDREFVELSRTLGGFHLAGFLTDEHGHALATALSAVAGVPVAGDDRTSAQRRAQALADLARLTLDQGLAGTGAAVRPHLSVHVTLDQLDPGATVIPLHSPAPAGAAEGEADGEMDEDGHSREDTAEEADADAIRETENPPVGGCDDRPPGPAGLGAPPWPGGPPPGPEDNSRLGQAFQAPATFEDGTPVPGALLARLACDSEVTRIVFGPPGIVLDVGRARRTVTGQLRRAVIARDRHCAYPGCTAPPALGEVHHVRHWTDNGVTSVANSILVCWHHHDLIHRTGIAITRTGATWKFTDRHGCTIERGELSPRRERQRTAA